MKYEGSYADFHENPTNALVTDITSWMDRRAWPPHKAVFLLLRKERLIKTNSLPQMPREQRKVETADLT